METDGLEPYKSLRTVIFEVQATAQPKPAAKKPMAADKKKTEKPAQQVNKANDVWQTASGSWGAKNKDGVTDYFDSEENAKAWISGKFNPAGKMEKPGDTSVRVDLDKDGSELKPSARKVEPQKNAQPTTAAAGQPAPRPAGGAASQTKAAPTDTQRPAQPQGQQASQPQAQVEPAKDEYPEVGASDPKTELDSAFKKDEKATAKAAAKPDVRKANVVAKAVKEGGLAGPKDDAESVFGDAQAERNFIDEMNHAALSAMRGHAAYDFELCDEVFAHIGFCFEGKTKKKVTKGIPRDQMPQFSSQVDPSRTDSEAFKALMAAKGYTSPEQVTPEDLKAEINMEKQFRAALESAGYDIMDEEVSVTTLKPIQGQLKGEKVAGMYGTLAAAQADPQNYGKQAARLLEPIYVSDGYVIDGHHRWAAQCALDIANGAGANSTMKTRTITKGGKPVPADEIIAFSNKFQKDIGLLSQTRGGETIPQKPKAQKEAHMSKFGSKRVQTIVESLNEAAKQKFKKPKIQGDEPHTFGVGAKLSRKAAVADKRGIKPVSIAQQVTRDARTEIAVKKNEKTAADMMSTMEKKPEGTTFEIYGNKNGKEVSVKVKKLRKMGDVVYMVGNSAVEVRVSGAGLQVIDKKTHRVYLDRGMDLIWESADLCDVGMISITEIRKLSNAELAKVRPGMPRPKKTKPVDLSKEALRLRIQAEKER